jgi:hypothetical protein
MHYFDAKPEPRDVQALDSDSDMQWPQPCCNRCFRADDCHQAYDKWKGFPVRTTSAFQDFDDDGSSDADRIMMGQADSELHAGISQAPPKIKELSAQTVKRIKLAVTHALKVFRVKHALAMGSSSQSTYCRTAG